MEDVRALKFSNLTMVISGLKTDKSREFLALKLYLETLQSGEFEDTKSLESGYRNYKVSRRSKTRFGILAQVSVMPYCHPPLIFVLVKRAC